MSTRASVLKVGAVHVGDDPALAVGMHTRHGSRAQRAAQLLQEPTARVAEVAAAVGYRQPAHFAKAFRRIYGVSPAKYRSNEYCWAEWHRRQREQQRHRGQQETVQE